MCLSELFPCPRMPKLCVVKVQNLSKRASREDLRHRLRQYARSISNIHIVNCPNSPFNYAYVNCTLLTVAQSIVQLVDRKMVLHSNQLTAALKWQGGQKMPHSGLSGQRYGRSSETRKMSNDVATKPTKHIYPLNPIRFLKDSYSCDPLVVKRVVQDMQEGIVRDEPRILVRAEESAVSVSVNPALAKKVRHQVESSISDHEAKLKTVVDDMDCCCLPVLAHRSVQERFAKSQAHFEVKVCGEGGYVPLSKLPQVYTGCGRKTVDAPELSQYLRPVENKEYRWYWENEAGFLPYGTSTSQSLEQVFASKATLTLSIGPNSYNVDTNRMTQTNIATNMVRRVERRPLPEIGAGSLLIQIRTHSDYLQNARSEILKCIQDNTTEVTVSIPPYGQDASSVDRLLKIAQKSFVFARKTDSGSIILRGREDVLTDVELKLTKEILQMKPPQVEVVVTQPSPDTVKRPGCWEEQDGRCELKLVGCGTHEWFYVWQRMTEDGLWLCNVLRIERIQNQWLWDVYDRSRKRMSDKNSGNVNQKDLFHGSRWVPPVKIYNSEQGFDNRLSSRGMWGEGAYFAVRAAYSDRYAYTTPEGFKQMFLVKVITGITYKCLPNGSLKAPPKKFNHPSALPSSESMFEDERYDSVSGNTNGSEIFVIYEHGKVYPAYLITYI